MSSILNLDDPNCNYHVTVEDLAWNFYIKQSNRSQKEIELAYTMHIYLDLDRQFIELGQFETVKKYGKKKWSECSFVRARESNLQQQHNDNTVNVESSGSSSSNINIESHTNEENENEHEHTSNTIDDSGTIEEIQEDILRQFTTDKAAISRRALNLAETSVDQAMQFVRQHMPYEFMLNAKK